MDEKNTLSFGLGACRGCRSRFVVAFNRDRDSYQVALALHESQGLARLVTDLYIPDSVAGSGCIKRLGLAHRHCVGLPSSLVSWSTSALWRQLVELRMASDDHRRLEIYRRLDAGLSRTALSWARKERADLFLYSGYALECFGDPSMRTRHKVLFVFHPHAALAKELLVSDCHRHPEMRQSHELHIAEMEASDSARLDLELGHADEIVCASSFTERSIVRVNNSNLTKSLHVVPYGCGSTDGLIRKEPIAGRRVRVLFVGQGVQRKGLHHLLKVWKRESAWNADLVVVASRIDPGARQLAEGPGPIVRLLPALSRNALAVEFAQADIFVMPSLVEGFGLVYLEALANGCHVIGTTNTGLPDLKLPSYAATIVNPGDLDELAQALRDSIGNVYSEQYSAGAIRKCAMERSWSWFRRGIRAAVGLAEPNNVFG